jgi:hypothetical protein
MSKADALVAVGGMAIAFRQENITPETTALYAEHLSDIPADLLNRSVSNLIQTQRFFPAISEVRERAARLAGLLPLSAPEALAIIRRADVERPVCRRDGSYAYTEHEWQWPDDVDSDALDMVRDTLAKVGDPVGGDGKARFGWETGFGKTYESHAEVLKAEVLADIPAALAARIDRKQIGGNNSLRLEAHDA